MEKYCKQETKILTGFQLLINLETDEELKKLKH